MIDDGMTTTARLAMARGLAEAVAGTGVTVKVVLLGPTRSEVLSNWMTAQAQTDGITIAETEQAFLKANRPTQRPTRSPP